MSTTWACPACRIELDANCVACGHPCPERGGRWVDFKPLDVERRTFDDVCETDRAGRR